MAHILEFSIEGLAGRKDTYHQKLNRDVNVFYGLNGSGKTSLLKILHSAMDGEVEVLKNVPFESAEVSLYSLSRERVYALTIEQARPEQTKGEQTTEEQPVSEQTDFSITNTVFLTGSILASYTSQATIKWSVQPPYAADFNGSWQHRYLPTSRLYLRGVRLQHAGSALLSEDQLDVYFADMLQQLWSRYFSDVLQVIRKAQEDGLANILKAILSPGRVARHPREEVDFESAYRRVAEFLKRQGSPDILGSPSKFQEQYKSNSEVRRIVRDINRVEEEIELAMAPRNKLENLIQTMFSGNKQVQFKDRRIDIQTPDNKTIGLSTLSSGEKQVLRILIETLLAEESSIIIDEPELSMHIDWQRQLVGSMRQLNPSAQIIMATHSPEIMAELNDDRIFRL